MNMKMQLTSNNIIVYITFLILIVLLIPQNSYAYRAEYARDKLEIVCRDDCKDSFRTLVVRGLQASFDASNVVCQCFNMLRSDNNKNLSQGFINKKGERNEIL